MSAVATVSISVDEAERITEQIVGRIDSISENVDAVMSLMREALSRNAHDALGYASPGAYISDRFGSALSGLSASLRREFVHELSEAGMSTRAIAPVFGVSQKTIVTDRQVIPRVSPEPEAMRPDEVAALMSGGFIDSVDQVAELIEADPATGEVIEPSVTEHTVTEKVKTTLGLDGKTYTRPAPKVDRRRSLVDDAFTANTNLWKAIEAIRTIRNDDRFTRNKADILAALQPSADLANEILADLFNITTKEK